MVSDVGSSLESQVIRGSTDEIEIRLVLKLYLCGHDGPFERAEFVETGGRIERSGLAD